MDRRAAVFKDGSMSGKIIPIVILCVALLVLLTGQKSYAEDYIIGADDELQINFWQKPALDQIVIVRQDGNITLTTIGDIQATGLTSTQLAEQIERSVSLYDRDVSQATITVIGFNSQKIFVAGQIANPDKYSYEVIPDLWTIIKEAGGATELGDLTRVTIIRSREEGGEIINVNVLEAIATGDLDRLPKLKSGDTIEVPRSAGGVPGRQLTTDYTQMKNLFYVIGQVNLPGQHEFEGEMDILDAIGLAGGPTENANLKDVQVITKNEVGTTVLRADLNEYRQQGQARRIKIKREDTIIIGQKKNPIISWENIRDFTALATSLITLYIIIDSQTDDGTQTQ